MKKNEIKRYIIIIIICVMSLTGLNSYAQDAVSRAEVEFVAGTGPTYPVHPEFPETEGNEGPVEGSLAIVSISHFDFGTMPVAASAQSLKTTTALPNIQVVDLRGTAAGWKVTASVTNFTSNSVDTLAGAEIQFVAGRPNSVSVAPAPTQEPNISLTTDESPVLIVAAKKGAGTGLWVMRWYPSEGTGDYVTLEIPAGVATIGSHTATINWILGDTP